MIEIKAEMAVTEVNGHFQVKGSYDDLVHEIYATLTILSKKCPGQFIDAVKMYSQDIIEMLVDKEVGE